MACEKSRFARVSRLLCILWITDEVLRSRRRLGRRKREKATCLAPGDLPLTETNSDVPTGTSVHAFDLLRLLECATVSWPPAATLKILKLIFPAPSLL